MCSRVWMVELGSRSPAAALLPPGEAGPAASRAPSYQEQNQRHYFLSPHQSAAVNFRVTKGPRAGMGWWGSLGWGWGWVRWPSGGLGGSREGNGCHAARCSMVPGDQWAIIPCRPNFNEDGLALSFYSWLKTGQQMNQLYDRQSNASVSKAFLRTEMQEGGGNIQICQKCQNSRRVNFPPHVGQMYDVIHCDMITWISLARRIAVNYMSRLIEPIQFKMSNYKSLIITTITLFCLINSIIVVSSIKDGILA